MTKQELRDLLLANFRPVAGVNFSDTISATRNAITDFYGLKDLSPREIRANKDLIMALIEEVIDEILPEKLEMRVGDFAEIKQFDRDAEVIFTIKNRGKRRAHLTIKRGARGGMYQAARLDDIQMSMETWTETVAVFVTLEEILLGKYSLQDLMNNILDGFEERLYVEVIQALQTSGNYSPAINQDSGAGIVQADFDALVRIVAAYGRPMILGFKQAISKLNNMVGWTSASPNISTQDLEDYRNKGFVGTYVGTPVVELQNYITDETTNANWLLDESFIFIIPAGEKPVKVALKGDMRIQTIEHPTGSMEQNAHKMLGVSLLLSNNIALYEDTTIV